MELAGHRFGEGDTRETATFLSTLDGCVTGGPATCFPTMTPVYMAINTYFYFKDA